MFVIVTVCYIIHVRRMRPNFIHVCIHDLGLKPKEGGVNFYLPRAGQELLEVVVVVLLLLRRSSKSDLGIV